MKFPLLYLKKREEQRLQAGHVWVYSNEIDTARSALSQFTEGQCVNVARSDGKVIGSAYVNPRSLICARVYSDVADTELNVEFFVDRIGRALRLRESLFSKPYYRLIHAEGDALPGLIIDRYGDAIVMQFNTAGMSRAEAAVLEAVETLLKPAALILRNDSSSREQEGLTQEVRVLKGENTTSVRIEENDTQFEIPLVGGQKTGWFYDHRMNRQRMRSYVQGKRVLDVFCYLGGWAVQAARYGAKSVTAVDASRSALDGVAKNALLNNVGDKVETICGDAFDVLRALNEQQKKYDVIIVDPPAFIKRKKDFDAGFSAYQNINALALSMLESEGVLMASSCSYHLSTDDLRRAVLKASRKVRVPLQLLEQGAQAPDHPIHPAIPETAYLKTIVVRKLI